MFRKTGGSSGNEELQTTGGGSGGGTVDQGTGGSSPWLVELDASQVPLPVTATIDPTGLATEAKQDVGNTSLSSIDTKLSSQATAANQTTANASLASIDTKLTSPVTVTGPLTDTQLRASAVPVSLAGVATLAEQQSQTSVLGATTGAKVITDANGSIQQYLRGLVYLLITPLAALVTVARKFIYNGIVTLTTTNFSGLTSTSGWQSDSITTNGAAEIQFFFTTLGAAGSTGLVDFYLSEAFASGNFTDGATGTEGTFTATNRKNSKYLGAIQLNTTNSVNGMLKYRDSTGSLPERVSLLGINNSGGTISATGSNTVFRYQLVN